MIINIFFQILSLYQPTPVRLLSTLHCKSNFLSDSAVFNYIGTDGESREFSLDTGSLAFTICQTPVVYKLAEKDDVTVSYVNGETVCFDTLVLNDAISSALFKRTAEISRIEVSFIRDEI